MNLEQLIQQFRVDSDDTVTNPPLWGNEWIAAWLTEAQAEAAIRGRLLYEAANPLVCEIAVAVDVTTYTLHKSIYEIGHLRFKAAGASRSERVHLISREELDRIWPDWRDEQGTPEYAIQDDTRITLAPRPTEAGTLHLEGYRVPLKALANDTDKPEINEAHHRHLVHWALHRAFSKPDAETIDPTRAAMAEAAFTAYFGARPDSNLRRATRSDVPQTNKVFWA
jgi:hypothetical protein